MTRAETIKNALRSMHRVKLLEKEMEEQRKNLETWLRQDRERSRRRAEIMRQNENKLRAELWRIEDAEAASARSLAE